MNFPLITTRAQVVRAVLTTAALGLALSAFALGTGYFLGYRHASAEGQAKLATAQRDAAIQSGETVRRMAARYQSEVEQGNQLAARLIEQREQLTSLHQQLRQRIRHVTTLYQPDLNAAPIPIPRTVFTVGFVRDWNTAFGLRAGNEATAPSGAATQADQASITNRWLWPDDLTDSGVTQADLLAHAEDVGQWCQTIEQQRDRLIDYLKPSE